MGNAEVFFIAALTNNTVSLEDRFNPKGHDSPVCVEQVSTQLAGSITSSGSLTATWTRPLAASGQGLTPIAAGQKFRAIAAWGPQKDRQAKPCAAGWPEHKSTGNAEVTF